MRKKIIYFFVLFLPLVFSTKVKAQVLFNMADYRNFAYTTAGYNGYFANVTIGIARRDYSRLFKREIIGILDVSLPLSNHFFTRHSVKKGFQVFIYDNKGIYK